MSFDLKIHSHRRYNPLTGEWIQVSPHRSKRPWQGQVEKTEQSNLLQYDPDCYLCPGNMRSNGKHNTKYTSTYSFTNDFSALTDDVPAGIKNNNELLIAKSEAGICKVICFSPHHNLTLAEMKAQEVCDVVDLWILEYTQLSEHRNINYIQIFENKGTVMGCSNPHPHGQIWAQESIPVEPLKKQHHQLEYFLRKKTTLLHDYLKIEITERERIVLENDHFFVLVPFWAVWPFETMIIPKRPMARITEMTSSERYGLADAYKGIAVRYDNLFNISFPYSAGIHQAPSDNQEHPEWHWHLSFYPPLLRSATVKKFMVGYELFSNPQRDITPEFSAEKLRSLSDIHYKNKQLVAS
jgi:UDPglucose--hexose-1-phosphate uridylyltransferase